MIVFLQLISMPLVFLVANITIVLIILRLNRLVKPPRGFGIEVTPLPLSLNPSEILGWEFEYARTTAGESMQDRHTMINYYLLVVGVVLTGVVAVRGKDSDLPKATAPILLWLLCIVGWFYFLTLIRLRQAWHDSVLAMNQIKQFYIEHAEGIDTALLRTAFRWKPESVPHPARAWTVYFYSAMLIGFLSSIAYIAGGLLLLDQSVMPAEVVSALVLIVFMGLIFFTFHVWMYLAFLTPIVTRRAVPTAGPAD
jgi:hypothetical protein